MSVPGSVVPTSAFAVRAVAQTSTSRTEMMAAAFIALPPVQGLEECEWASLAGASDPLLLLPESLRLGPNGDLLAND